MTKIAMIRVHDDPIMKECGFRMLIPVHDEIIGEAPYEYAIRAGNRLVELMVGAASGLSVPFKCDCEYQVQWYGKSLTEEDIQCLIDGTKVARDFY